MNDSPNDPNDSTAETAETAAEAGDSRSSTRDPEPWGADHVRQLRGYLGETQTQFADRLGTRQQTVSEWETGSSKPRRIARRLLQLVAEERGFYAFEPLEAAPDHAAPDQTAPDQAVPDHTTPRGEPAGSSG